MKKDIQLKRVISLPFLIFYGVGTIVGGGFYALLAQLHHPNLKRAKNTPTNYTPAVNGTNLREFMLKTYNYRVYTENS